MVEPQPSKLMTWVRFPLPAPLSKIVAPDENIDKSTVKVDFFRLYLEKERMVWYDCYYKEEKQD